MRMNTWRGRRTIAADMLRLVIAILLLGASTAGGVGSAVASGLPAAIGVVIAGDDAQTRIVLDFDRKPQFRTHLLSAPSRLVIDLEQIAFGFGEGAKALNGMVADFRYGNMGAGQSRIIVTTKGPFEVQRAELRDNELAQGVKLIIDLGAADPKDFAAAVAGQDKPGAMSGPAVDAAVAPKADPSRFLVVIDPGHGGIDTGASGHHGTLEKDVTLAFASEFRRQLDARAGVTTLMTREADNFVSLDDRMRFAREHAADLFISIHADSIKLPGIRGATFYTVSEEASDDMAQQVAAQENHADAIAGVTIDAASEPVADILIDLARRETLGFSVRFTRMAIDELKGMARLINNPHRHAGFRVLRAHDVPSVLVELGYLSNVEDEKLLQQPKWRAQIAARLADAVARFAAIRGAGGQ